MSLATAWTLWSGLLFGQAEILPAPLPEADAARLPALHRLSDTTPEQRAHLEQAVQHLRAGGLTVPASQLEAALHEAQQVALRQELEQKQAQLRTLQQEVAALEKKLGTADAIQLNFTMLEVDRQKLIAADAVLNIQLQTRLATLAGRIFQPDPGINPATAAELLQQLGALTESGAVKVLSRPTIRTLNNQEARFHSGGAFPIVVPTAHGGELQTEFREFGTSVTVLPKLVGPGVIHCRAKYEQADRDFETAVYIGWTKVPGLTKRTVETQFTAAFGDTVMFPCPETPSKVTLVFVTVERAEEAVATAQPPMNQVEPAVSTAVVPQPSEVQPLPPSSKSQPWISPIQLLMRTLLETDTDRFIPPATMDVDVKYYLAPSLPQPAVLPQPVPAPQQ